jgi:HK97 family phage portal protein
MGLGKILTRNLKYDVTNTQTGGTGSFTIVTDGGPGAFAAWSAGEYQGGMGIPAAWRLALLIANQLGRTPWHGFRERAGRPAEKLDPQPLILTDPVGSADTALNTWRALALDRLWHGNAVAVIAARSPLGYPVALTPASAENVQVQRFPDDDPLSASGWRPAGFLPGEVGYLIGGRWYHARDVVHWRGPAKPGSLRGMGILENHFATLERTRAQDESASSVTSSAVPTGLLESLNPDLTKAEADALKVAWTTAQRQRTVAVLNPTTKYTPIAWSPSETQLLESRQYSLVDWANIFGLPVSYANGQNASRVYANIVDQGLDMLRFGQVGDLVAELEALLTTLIPRGSYVKGNLDHLLRPDTQARYEAHAIAIMAGFLTPDEARALEEREPLTAAQMAQILAVKQTAAAGQGGGQASSSAGTGNTPPRLAAVRAMLERLDDMFPPSPGMITQAEGEFGPGDGPVYAHPNDLDPERQADPEEIAAWEADVADGMRAADLSGAKLKRYWTAGPGLAKWRGSPTPWRTLRKFLSKYLSGEKLDATTSSWYRIVFGALPQARR